MATETQTTDIDSAVLDDLRAVIKHIQDKTPLNPELYRRVKERGARITERLRQDNIDIDVVKLLREARDES
jgi:hypothetical protein